MSLEKEYGKLTIDQFRDLVKMLPEVRGQMKELPDLARSKPEKLKEILGNGYHWSSIYELGFIEQIAYLMVLLGWQGFLKDAAATDDQYDGVMQLIEDGGVLDQWYEDKKDVFEKRHLIWLTVVMQRNVLSIMLFHRPLSALVEEVRQGSDEAFFKAVRIDRSILSCPTFADRLAHAELTQNKAFFLHLRSALKGPLKKHWEALYDLRYAIAILREMGFDSLSDAQLEDIFVNKLKLYPKHESARKNLRKHFYEAKKVSTT